MVPAVSSYPVPGMCTTIAGIEDGASEVEVVAMRVAGVDAEVPIASFPVQGTIEVGGCAESLPLPVEQDIAHVQVAALPVGGVYVVVACHTHQVVEVNLIGGLILFVCEV